MKNKENKSLLSEEFKKYAHLSTYKSNSSILSEQQESEISKEQMADDLAASLVDEVEESFSEDNQLLPITLKYAMIGRTAKEFIEDVIKDYIDTTIELLTSETDDSEVENKFKELKLKALRPDKMELLNPSAFETLDDFADTLRNFVLKTDNRGEGNLSRISFNNVEDILKAAKEGTIQNSSGKIIQDLEAKNRNFKEKFLNKDLKALISYDAGSTNIKDEQGQILNTKVLKAFPTERGEAQLNFLARVLSGRRVDGYPIEWQYFYGPNVKYKSAYQDKAYKILKNYFNQALKKTAAILKGRKEYSDLDVELKTILENAVSHMLEMVASGKYDQNQALSFGSWAFTVIKNRIVESIKEETFQKIESSPEAIKAMENSPFQEGEEWFWTFKNVPQIFKDNQLADTIKELAKRYETLGDTIKVFFDNPYDALDALETKYYYLVEREKKWLVQNGILKSFSQKGDYYPASETELETPSLGLLKEPGEGVYADIIRLLKKLFSSTEEKSKVESSIKNMVKKNTQYNESNIYAILGKSITDMWKNYVSKEEWIWTKQISKDLRDELISLGYPESKLGNVSVNKTALDPIFIQNGQPIKELNDFVSLKETGLEKLKDVVGKEVEKLKSEYNINFGDTLANTAPYLIFQAIVNPPKEMPSFEKKNFKQEKINDINKLSSLLTRVLLSPEEIEKGKEIRLENKNMNKLRLKIRKMLMENKALLEQAIRETEEGTSQVDKQVEEIKKLGSSKFSEKWSYDWIVKKGTSEDRKFFNEVIKKAIIEYQNKRNSNIFNFLISAFNPSYKSLFNLSPILMASLKAAGTELSWIQQHEEVLDEIILKYYEDFEDKLLSYKPDSGTNFSSYIIRSMATDIIDAVRKMKHTTRLDFNNNDDEKSGYYGEKIVDTSSISKEKNSSFKEAFGKIMSVIKKNLSDKPGKSASGEYIPSESEFFEVLISNNLNLDSTTSDFDIDKNTAKSIAFRIRNKIKNMKDVLEPIAKDYGLDLSVLEPRFGDIGAGSKSTPPARDWEIKAAFGKTSQEDDEDEEELE